MNNELVLESINEQLNVIADNYEKTVEFTEIEPIIYDNPHNRLIPPAKAKKQPCQHYSYCVVNESEEFSLIKNENRLWFKRFSHASMMYHMNPQSVIQMFIYDEGYWWFNGTVFRRCK
jgi:hypothetical protein